MPRNSTIKSQMIALTAMVLFSMTALGGAGYFTFDLIRDRNAITDMLERETTGLHLIQRTIAEIVLIPDNPQTVKTTREELRLFGDNLETLIVRSEERALTDALVSRIKPQWKKIEQDAQTFLKISRPNPDDVDTMITFGKLTSNIEKLLKEMTRLKQETQSHTATYIARTTAIMGGIAVFLILSTALVLTSIFRSIARPLEQISCSAQEISRGNLKTGIAVQRSDEIGVVADSFRTMIASLRTMIGQTASISDDVNQAATQIAESSSHVFSAVRVQNSAIESTVRSIEEVEGSISLLQENSRKLFDDATTTSSAAAELAASISQVAENASDLDTNARRAVSDIEEMVVSGDSIVSSVDKLSVFAEETCRSIEQIGSTIRKVQDSANRSVSLAEQVSHAASDQGMAALQDAMAGIENIRHSVSALTEVVNRLGSKSAQIGKIITVIEDIASQTGLLALNAAILAAQAGQHGRSFAVVASEIRSLSDRTMLSTKEIVDVITSVQAESTSSVKMAQTGMDAVQKGVSLIGRVKEALESIHNTAQASTGMAHAIHKETSAEVEVINTINESIVILREQINEISRSVNHQNGNTGDMNRLMEQITRIAGEIAVATREQSKTSLQISHIADNLLQQSNDINTSVSLQKQKSHSVVTASSSIREASDQLAQLANSLEQAAEALRSKATSLSSSINTFEV